MPPGAPQAPARQSGPLTPASQIQVPKMKFGGVEISRMVLGVNPFYGFAHYNNNFGTVMKEWYTQDKVCDVMHQANRFGINAFNYVHLDRGPQDWARFVAEGGKMHLIIQVTAGVDAGDAGEDPPAAGAATAGRSGRHRLPERRDGQRQGVVQEGAGFGSAWSAWARTSRKSSRRWRRRTGTSISIPAASTTGAAPWTNGRRC